MANNYTQFSAFLECPMDDLKLVAAGAEIGVVQWAEQEDMWEPEDVKEFCEGIDESIESGSVSVNGVHFEHEPGGVWIHSDESGDIELVAEVVAAIQDMLKLDNPFFLSWASTCSKPRVDEFCGGALCIQRGYDNEWVNAMMDLKTKINQRRD